MKPYWAVSRKYTLLAVFAKQKDAIRYMNALEEENKWDPSVWYAMVRVPCYEEV